MPNDRQLPDFLKRPSLYIIVGPNDRDRGIAETIAAELRDVTDPECLTLSEAAACFPQPICRSPSFQPTYWQIPATLSPSATCLPALIARVFFRHYYVSRGLALETLKADPSLAPLFESILVRDSESHSLGSSPRYAISLSRVVPTSPAAATLVRDGWALGITGVAGTYVGRLLLLVYRLSFLAGFALAAMWWASWLPPSMEWLVDISAWAAGYNHGDVHPADFWLWLGRRWQVSNTLSRSQPLPLFGERDQTLRLRIRLLCYERLDRGHHAQSDEPDARRYEPHRPQACRTER